MRDKIGNAIYWLFSLIAICLIFVAEGGAYPEGYYALVVRGVLLYLIGRDMRSIIIKKPQI